ncbi:phosphoribosylglycinamide formyltransferase [Flavobacteriales bacterium]|nr:phosphoribosylglycinamide formyltransferase [Flavobacteriales bacterium]
MKNIAILASGSGTNAEAIAKHLEHHTDLNIALIASNKDNAYVLRRAEKLGIASVVFSSSELRDGNLLQVLKSYNIDYIILAGFLLKIPVSLVTAFPNKIINIHPALLPKYGGKGMYGGYVHQSVIENKEKESGITIHYVNENFDEGEIIFQASCSISSEDTAESLAEKIHKLEHNHFPKIIETLWG